MQVIKKCKDEHGDIGEKSFVIRRNIVLDALFWMQKYNRHYSDVIVDATRLDWIEKTKQNFQTQRTSKYTTRMLSKLKCMAVMTSSTLLLSMEVRKKIMELLPLE